MFAAATTQSWLRSMYKNQAGGAIQLFLKVYGFTLPRQQEISGESTLLILPSKAHA